jgi:hypothetical protein
MPSRQVISPDVWALKADLSVRMAAAYLRPIADAAGRFRWDPKAIAAWTGLDPAAAERYLEDLWRAGDVVKYQAGAEVLGQWSNGSGLPPSQRRSRFPGLEDGMVLDAPPWPSWWREFVVLAIGHQTARNVDIVEPLLWEHGLAAVLEVLAFAYRQRPKLALASFVSRYPSWVRVHQKETS